MKDFTLFFSVQFISYFLIVANTRAYTLGLYGWTALTDLIFTSLNFWLIQRVAAAKTKAAFAGYCLGGTTGALVSIFITQHFYGK